MFVLKDSIEHGTVRVVFGRSRSRTGVGLVRAASYSDDHVESDGPGGQRRIRALGEWKRKSGEAWSLRRHRFAFFIMPRETAMRCFNAVRQMHPKDARKRFRLINIRAQSSSGGFLERMWQEVDALCAGSLSGPISPTVQFAPSCFASYWRNDSDQTKLPCCLRCLCLAA